MSRSNVGGVSYVAGRVSVAQPHAVNVAHELGHNLSLAHAPGCSAPNPDPRATGVNRRLGLRFRQRWPRQTIYAGPDELV